VIMNFPESHLSRKCCIIPFMSDNEIELTNPSTTQITWISHREEDSMNVMKGGRVTVTRVYQFNWKKWRLQEFNL
jgi:hypothetical protein